MAKCKPTITLSEMEKELGYGAHALALPSEPFTRFYSDLNPVIDSAYEKMQREYEEHQRTKNFKCDAHSAKNKLQGLPHAIVSRSTYLYCNFPHSDAAHTDAPGHQIPPILRDHQANTKHWLVPIYRRCLLRIWTPLAISLLRRGSTSHNLRGKGM